MRKVIMAVQDVINGDEMSRYLLCLKILVLGGNRHINNFNVTDQESQRFTQGALEE